MKKVPNRYQGAAPNGGPAAPVVKSRAGEGRHRCADRAPGLGTLGPGLFGAESAVADRIQRELY